MTVIAPERHFPDDQEVDQWIADRFLDETQMASSSPMVDQLKAAANDSVNRFRASAPGLVISGQMRMAFLDIPDSDRTKVRGAVRQVMAAESAGLAPLCPHTQLARPLLLVCDPPVVVCTECIERNRVAFDEAMNALGHLWNYQCDRCGVHVELLSATATVLGHVTVAAHLCGSCVSDDQRFAEQRADKIVIVPPRPRPRKKRKKRSRNR